MEAGEEVFAKGQMGFVVQEGGDGEVCLQQLSPVDEEPSLLNQTPEDGSKGSDGFENSPSRTNIVNPF